MSPFVGAAAGAVCRMENLKEAESISDPTHALVTQIARALVDHPEAVQVQALVREESTVLRLHVSDSDIGKVIGKQGRTAHSLRTILSAVSMKYHHRYTLDIVENSDAPHAQHHAAPAAAPIPVDTPQE
jgi:predicted RNA-binding protein YlqC (UPF0109 family)